ncbi:TRAP transporter fused permease subunit [Aestuariivita sp.]|uniref:TRAP transporter permease n=1 Tax=Aestuariivita sp. TaxID=1872407 RepID=UPI002170FB4C|nr:TRAP transporter fused permease subunit [Aestuariivita sp.]MCE8005621.1 TRAP transporter fused permease subunit [Aestuariivita sp.]
MKKDLPPGPGWAPAIAGVLSNTAIVIAVAWAAGLHRGLGIPVYTEQFLALMLGLALAITFLTLRSRLLPALDWALALAALAGGGWLALRYPSLSIDASIDPLVGLPVAVPLLVALVEGLRRCAGWPLTLIILVFLTYGYFGNLVPGTFQALAIRPERLTVQLALDTNGVLGTPLLIAATVVVVFVTFGRLLEHLGGAEFFTRLAALAMGTFRGGAAKVSILASSLFGSISGSAVSNVATTGVVTIPLMKRSGFPARSAAGIEAVASTGGQLMPPVMGASAFLMAEFLEIPYAQVVVAALVPAILYYIALFVLADLISARDRIGGIDRDAVATSISLTRGWPFVVPFVALVVALFVLNYQPATAGLVAGATLMLVAPLLPEGLARLNPLRLWKAVAAAGQTLAQIIIITAAAGIVIGVLNETGLSFGLTSSLTRIAGDSVILLLVLAALISIVLGMGMPTIAVYVLLAALVAPALVRLGIEPIAAHLFVLYFGMMSMITPPVAIAAFAAASLGNSDPMRTGFEAMKFGWPAYVLPFAFALNPALILNGSGLMASAIGIVTTTLGVIVISAAIVGYAKGRMSFFARLGALGLGTALIGWPFVYASG